MEDHCSQYGERELNVELRHLRYFIRAAELSNFTKAAESLFVSQPTLSVQIHQLEAELGTELFSRVGRNVRLTEAGRVFLARARQAVKELEEGSKEIDAMKGLLRGNLCIAALPLYGSRLLSGWLSIFIERHPQVYIRAKAESSDDIAGAVISGVADLGFTILPVQNSELNTRELFEDEIVLVASNKHPISKKRTLKAGDFHDLQMALPSERVSATQLLGKYFEDNKIQPRISMSYDDGHALIEIVKTGKFVTCLPLWGVQGDPDITAISLPGAKMKIKAAAVWTSLSPASEALLNLMSEEAKALSLRD